MGSAKEAEVLDSRVASTAANLNDFDFDQNLRKVSVKAKSGEIISYDPIVLANELKQAFRRLRKALVGYDDIVHQALFALLTREHQLIYSRAGMAKSLFANTLFGQFKEVRTFNIQLTKGTPEEGLVGAINIEELKKGNIIHNTDGSIVDASLAFIDEIFDGNDVALRSLLGILNERQFNKGKQHVTARLHSAFAATNYLRASDVTEAVVDRFAFKALLLPTSDPYEMLSIDLMYGERAGTVEIPSEEERVPIEHLEVLAQIIEGRVPECQITAPAHVLFMKNALVKCYVDLVNEARKKRSETELYVSPRTIAKTRDVLNASALLSGRSEVSIEDLSSLRFMITTVGDQEQLECFEQALHKVTNAYDEDMCASIDFLSEAQELFHAIQTKLDGHENLESSLMDRIKIFFGLSTIGKQAFSKVRAYVANLETTDPLIKELQSGILKEIDQEIQRINGKDLLAEC